MSMWSSRWKQYRHVTRVSFLLLGLCVLTGGCGGKATSDVTGTVTYKGKALEFGSVSVFASDEKGYTGEIQSNGTYTIKKVPVGPARVAVECTDPKLRDEIKDFLKKKPADGKMQSPPNLDPKKLHLIPEAYNTPDRSGLRVE